MSLLSYLEYLDNMSVRASPELGSRKETKQEELTSRPVGQKFHALDVLSLPFAWTKVDKKWKERKL